MTNTKRGKTTPASTAGSFAPKNQSAPVGSLTIDPPLGMGARFGRGYAGPYWVRVTGSMQGQETPAWEGELLKGDTVIAHLHQSGTGGMTMSYFDSREAREEWERFVEENWGFPNLIQGTEYGTHTDDSVIDTLKHDADTRAEFRKHARRGLPVLLADQAAQAHDNGEVSDFTLLNTKDPEAAAQHLRENNRLAGAYYFDGNGWTPFEG